MKVTVLQTLGHGEFFETNWQKPEPTDTEIEVKSLMTGVCRSDIDMMIGDFGPLPINMQGHEGLAQVTKVGSSITDIHVDDIVATRGEPAYADYYNVKRKEYVQVPEVHPRYIIEPVACGINIVEQSKGEIEKRQGGRLLILGSGFLAWVAYHTIVWNKLDFEINVIGSSNKAQWGEILEKEHAGKYDVIIDLSSRNDVLTKDILNVDALIVFGSQKSVATDFRYLLWNACTMIFPSPRNDKFYHCMKIAVHKIENGELDVDKFWSRSYNRTTEWKQAFDDSIHRPRNYSRGYIRWD